MPAIGALMGSVRRRSSTLYAGAGLVLQADGHEVVRRPRAGVRELQRPLEAATDVLHLLVEHVRLSALDEEGRIQDHPVTDHLVRARGQRGLMKRVVDLTHEGLGLLRERLLHETTELHAREVRRRRLVSLDLCLEAADLLVLL